MRWRSATFFLLLSFAAAAAPNRPLTSTDPLLLAADYYYDHQDYHQALPLYREVLKHQPASLSSAVRLAELKQMYESRSAARETLLQFLAVQNSLLSTEGRRLLREKIESVATLFVSDEGQNSFLQALVEIKDKGCVGAMPLLTQAATLEAGNTKVLKEKAHCERQLGTIRPFYETLKVAFESNPFDISLAEGLSEADVYYQEFGKVVERYRLAPELLRSTRGRIAFAVSLEATGATSEALPRLQSLVSEQKLAVVHPAVLFALGRLLSQRSDSAAESRLYLERFLATAVRAQAATEKARLQKIPLEKDLAQKDLMKVRAAGESLRENTLPTISEAMIEGWDLYHIDDKIIEARKILLAVKAN